ncbi:uncharacterized protein BO97DRAFT_424748 [Aspergillus homomorphus CBS 101889]|uniref:Uncharacterized protein n=1 Tax=Aspergillus homomorphus (strain CBS 101889) TaxID=1450537 RepID=A0A395I110_ASPHC|nr:hypothetical protein BO97DRAFT_424748 [Aspergillus homomorphus CBS 101889]RAL12224.1 hypothetical protein BO97DRAFT_424748 [Aspergillus homomorphus CBS 101889]
MLSYATTIGADEHTDVIEIVIPKLDEREIAEFKAKEEVEQRVMPSSNEDLQNGG